MQKAPFVPFVCFVVSICFDFLRFRVVRDFRGFNIVIRLLRLSRCSSCYLVSIRELFCFRVLKLAVFNSEASNFFFWLESQAIMRRRISIR